MSLFPVVTEEMLSRAIRSQFGKSNLVQEKLKNSMNQLTDVTDEAYVSQLRERLEQANIPDLRVEIELGRGFAFRVSSKVADTWLMGFGRTFDQALTNLRAHTPSAAEQARNDREMAAALMERAAKIEAEAAA